MDVALELIGLPQTMNLLEVKWYDLGGRLLLVQDITNAGGTATLDPMLGTGIYFMSFQTSAGVIRTQRIIIKK